MGRTWQWVYEERPQPIYGLTIDGQREAPSWLVERYRAALKEWAAVQSLLGDLYRHSYKLGLDSDTEPTSGEQFEIDFDACRRNSLRYT